MSKHYKKCNGCKNVLSADFFTTGSFVCKLCEAKAKHKNKNKDTKDAAN